ncbi:MAG: hypothetical protein HC831_27040 [Chloroflexia bacterium]|nr:hypothetical protein [Chloroflexia bacterium]
MSILDYFELVDMSSFSFDQKEVENKFSYLHIDKSTTYQKLSEYDIVILGVEEERNTSNKGTHLAPDKIREQFYKLNQNGKTRILDIGNLRIGKSLKDTYTAIRDVVFELVQKNIVPIIIGGGQDLTYGIYLGLDKLNHPISIVSIDPKLDLGYKKTILIRNLIWGKLFWKKGKISLISPILVIKLTIAPRKS